MGMFGQSLKAAAQSAPVDPSQLSRSDRMMLLGATLRDTGSALRGDSGDAVVQMQQLMQARQQQALKAAFQKRLEGMVAPQYQNGPDPTVAMPAPVSGAGMPDAINLGAGSPSLMSQDVRPPPMPGNLSETFAPRNDEAPQLYRYTPPVKTSDGLNINSPELPSLALQAQGAGVNMDSFLDVLKAQKPADPKYFEGNDGIYREQPDHSFRRVQDYPAAVPAGFRVSADGKGLEFVPNGPADPTYIARTAGVRRDAVVTRPMPGRARPINPNAIKWD